MNFTTPPGRCLRASVAAAIFVLAIAACAAALAASPKPAASLIETTPPGYMLAASATSSGNTGHLGLICPNDHGLGNRRQIPGGLEVQG